MSGRPVPNPAGPPKGAPRPGRMGWCWYARIVAEVLRRPRTSADVAQRLGRGAQNVREIMSRLELHGVLHIAGWQPPPSGIGALVPVFSAKPGASVPYPGDAVPAQRRPYAGGGRPELLAFVAIVRELQLGGTRVEIAEATGTAVHRVSPLLKEMHALRMVYRREWLVSSGDSRGGVPAEVFAWGARKDAPRPAALTPHERAVRHWQRRKARKAAQAVVRALAGRAPVPVHSQADYRVLAAACPMED